MKEKEKTDPSSGLIRVVHFTRKPGPDAHSIERIYSDLTSLLPARFFVERKETLFYSRGFFRRVVDTIFAVFRQGDVNHIIGDCHFLVLLLAESKTMLTIHDCNALNRTMPGRFLLWLFWFKLPVMRVKRVVTVSEYSKSNICEVTGCPAHKVEVIHNFVSPEFKPTVYSFNQEKPRILQLGTKANKNLTRVLEAIEGIHCELTVIGRMSESQHELIRRFGVDCRNLYSLERNQLVDEYKRTDLVVLASTDEGFGMPIIEANAVGRPVLTSTVASMPEVAGEAACLVNPFCVEDIRRGIQKVFDDDGYREELIELGFLNVQRFSPKVAAERYAEVYQKLAGR